jgi:hypothetical protein
MTELELYYDGSTAVRWHDPKGLQPSTAALAVQSAAGATLETPTVTKPTLSTTIQAGSTASIAILASVTGLVVGSHLAITSDGVVYVVRVARIDGTSVHVSPALPLVPDTGAAVKHLDMSASVAALGSSYVGARVRLAWTYDDGTTYERTGQQAVVVRWPWVPLCTAGDVADTLQMSFATSRSAGWCQVIADRVNDSIRGGIAQTGRRASMYLSSDIFRDAVSSGVRMHLALEGVCHGGDTYNAQREMRFAFADAMTAALTAANPTDIDGDGQISAAEDRFAGMAIKARR